MKSKTKKLSGKSTRNNITYINDYVRDKQEKEKQKVIEHLLNEAKKIEWLYEK